MAEKKSSWDLAKGEQLRLKQEALLEEAAILFNHKGYSATSLEDIAERLNITKTAIYHYVKNKSDLLYQCYLRAMDATEECYEKADASGANGLEKIVHYLRLDAASGPIAMTPLSELDSIKNETARNKLAARLDQCEIQFQNFIIEGIKDGSIAECDPKMTMQFILGASRWTMKWYSPKGQKALSEIVEDFLSFVLKGLIPR
tara:strand:- start:1265 stop:1870 length:606 start_codon:yes stop_codon:yes gene_type:complete